MFRIFIPFAIWLLTSLPVFAHELWIEPESFENETGSAVNAALINGQDFEGTSLAYATRSISRLEIMTSDGFVEIEGILGNRPAIQLNNLPDGLLVVGYESIASRLAYRGWDKFLSFADEKGLDGPEDTHRAMGISFENFDEGYTRFSKSLISLGNGAGRDGQFGFETELVALLNPYNDNLEDGLPVLLLYRGKPKPNALVQVFSRDTNGTVTKSNLMTDANGVVSLITTPGHDYMMDAVTFRAPSSKLLERMDVHWETLWANLTFAVPE